MVFQSTAAFHRLLSYMVHPTKSLVSVWLAQARTNNANSGVGVIFGAYSKKLLYVH